MCQSQVYQTIPQPQTVAYSIAIPSSFSTAVVEDQVQFKYSSDNLETRYGRHHLIINYKVFL